MTKTRPNTIAQFCQYGTIILPGGLRCVEIESGSTKGKFFLDEFPKDLFPPNSMHRHDAQHYGIVLERDQVDFGETTVQITFSGEHFAESFRRLVRDTLDGRCGAKAIYCAIRRALRDGRARIKLEPSND